MYLVVKFKRKLFVIISLILVLSAAGFFMYTNSKKALYVFKENGESYIKWVNFDIPLSLMQEAIKMDTESYNKPDTIHLNWIELLSIAGTNYYGNYSKYKVSDLHKIADDLKSGKTPQEITNNNKHFSYYLESYTAVLGGFVGEYEIEVEENGSRVWQKKYGLKAFSPIAKGYAYTDYDDFGNSRNYSYKRKHLGHDMMALTGTPVIAVESGVIEVMGWNQYGGWRIGIRSFNGVRYYYYAHLRQNRPFAEGMEVGKIVMAGDVVGYVGHTGYSTTENTNGIKQSHLHYGLQLIFDDSQKDGVNQIWLNLYDLTRLLASNRTLTERNAETKEHTRVYDFRETIPEDRFVPGDDVPDDQDGCDDCGDGTSESKDGEA